MRRNPANRFRTVVLTVASPLIVFALVVAAPANSVDDGTSSGASDEPLKLALAGSISTASSSGTSFDETSQDAGCGCCFDEFAPRPLKKHVIYASAYPCPRSGTKRALDPQGAHGDARWGSCLQRKKHKRCGAVQ